MCDTMYRMRYIALSQQLRAARRHKGLSQAALAGLSGVSRVTIARVEGGSAQDFRIGTLSRLCEALDLEITAQPRGARPSLPTLLARAQERALRLERRGRHAALAARLLALPRPAALALVQRTRAVVDRWERDQLCSQHYVSRWRALLVGPRERVARSLLDPGEWADALFQNSPWTFALEAKAA
jgi:transcriptional regulator with XRE-family HTH domain